MYLAIDPGKGTVDSIGWAEFTDDGRLIRMGQDTRDAFVGRLETYNNMPVKKVIYEEYKIFKKRVKAHINSKVETVQTIGIIKSWCIRNKVEWVEQPSLILGPAQNLFQVSIPEDHRISHQISAMLHGMYWLWEQKIIKSALEEQVAKAG